MILPRPADALHKAWLYRLLTGLLEAPEIAQNVYFKGGTCASMLGFLDRFSVDLDFDLGKGKDKERMRKILHQVFARLDLKVKDESKKALQFFLKYPAPAGKRNTIKLDILDSNITSSQYASQYLAEIDRFANCQTKETMFAHKLVTVTDRFEKNKTLAGRDIYDVHYFFMQGFSYHKEIIKERTEMEVKNYLEKLKNFIEKKVTQTVIDQDLNVLLPTEKFQQIRKILKREVLMFIGDEIKRLSLS